MGHKVGWLTLYAGIASGADVILIPEIPYDIEKVCEAINRRKERGSGFTILAVAEGAIAKEDAALPKKELKKRQEEIAKKYPSVSYKIAEEIEAWKSASPYRATCSEAAARVRMTVSFPQDSDPRQHSLFWTNSTATWSEWSTEK